MCRCQHDCCDRTKKLVIYKAEQNAYNKEIAFFHKMIIFRAQIDDETGRQIKIYGKQFRWNLELPKEKNDLVL